MVVCIKEGCEKKLEDVMLSVSELPFVTEVSKIEIIYLDEFLVERCYNVHTRRILI